MISRTDRFRRLTPLLLGGAALLPVACERAVEHDLPRQPRILATEELSREIEEFAGGHAKLVWAKNTAGSGIDTFANEERLELWGIDTRDHLGVRPILTEPSNYARPLITPSGNDIVFTHKGTHLKGERKPLYFNPTVFRVSWDGTHLEKLAEGYAVDVWRDPSTSVEWVYVADLEPTEYASMFSKKLERFKLLDPGEREIVWDRGEISLENFQLSRDGTRASCLFPWPDAGVLHIPDQRPQRYQNGCWPSLAPDDSYLAWVFDGSHKNLHLFTDLAKERWKVPLNEAPGIDGHEVYHPRWSNHARFLALTGPYTGTSIGQSDPGEVEVFLGRFDEEKKRVEAWLQVTRDTRGEVFPDLWIAHAEPRPGQPTFSRKDKAEEEEKKKLTEAADPTAGRAWPVTGLPLLFVWEDRQTDNRAGEGGQFPVGVEARGGARFGPWFDLRVDGGHFEADGDSARRVANHFSGLSAPFTLEVLATPLTGGQDGIVIGNEQFQLKQRGNDWIYLARKPKPAKLWIGNARPGQPNHLVVAFDGAQYLVMHNGKTVSQDNTDVGGIEMLAGRRGLNFGSGWDGALEAISLAPGRLDESRLEASWEYLREKIAAREAIPRVRLRGKLVAATPPRPVEALDTYQRALLGYLYEVEEVLEGSYERDKVVVMHWTILDRRPVPGFPRQIGESYELRLEPLAAHPQLTSERQWNDLTEPLDAYYDVETPQP